MKCEVYFSVYCDLPKLPLTTADFGECGRWKGEDLCLDNVVYAFLARLTLAKDTVLARNKDHIEFSEDTVPKCCGILG